MRGIKKEKINLTRKIYIILLEITFNSLFNRCKLTSTTSTLLPSKQTHRKYQVLLEIMNYYEKGKKRSYCTTNVR